MSDDESERVNTEDVPLAERSDASLILLLSDLVYGPGMWIDSYEIQVASGEWKMSDTPNLGQPRDPG